MIKSLNVGIIGNGFVGNATSQLKTDEINVFIFDIDPDKCQPKNVTLEQLCSCCDIFFICLPTPMKQDGSCHLGIIEGVVKEMEQYLDFNKTPVVIRSTVPVGTAEKFNCFFMPEFLTEANARQDFKNTNCWIFGLKEIGEKQNYNFQNEIIPFILESNLSAKNIASSDTLFVSTKEAEAIKLFKNTFLAVKVGFCNEFFRFCEANSINYDTVIEGSTMDPRITKSHTTVPGPNGKFGFGGTCFPKDISSLQYQLSSVNVPSPIVDAVIERNNMLDRKEQDWKSDTGRAFINS